MVDEATLRSRIMELDEMLSFLPKSDASRASQSNYISHAPPPGSRTVDELLDHLRLQIKYVMFDLEATRRENRYLRSMLERRSNLGEGTDSV